MTPSTTPRNEPRGTPSRAKYKALHGAVRSFSEGITGILCSGFQQLACHAIESGTFRYRLDFLAQASTPDIPTAKWRQWLFTYFDLNEWFDAIGCSLAHIRKVEMDAEFDMTSIQHTESETRVYVNAMTVFEDDRGKRHVYQLRTPVFFSGSCRTPTDETVAVPPVRKTGVLGIVGGAGSVPAGCCKKFCMSLSRQKENRSDRKRQPYQQNMLLVSQEAVRKLMRHGWNVYPLEAFGFLLGTANPPCVYAALPTSKTAQWDSHADRWNALQERRTIADEVATRFGLQVVGVYATHEVGDNLQSFPAAFAAGIVITYSFDWGTNPNGVFRAVLHAPGVGRDDWELSRGKRLSPEFNQRRILAAWRARVGPIDYSNNYKTEYPRLYGTLPLKKTRYAQQKQQEPDPHRAPSPVPSPHRPPPPDPLNRWNTSQRVAVGTDRPLSADQQTILSAIRNQTTLTFRYIGGTRPGVIRTTRPKELFQVVGYSGFYILADDLDLDEERVFRLDRIDWKP